MKLFKYHGSGNDFIVFDEMKYGMLNNEEIRKDVVMKLCNRRGSMGADGVLFVQSSNTADAKMRIFNSDGSEPEMCGNGLRCFARYIMDEFAKDEIIVETMKNNYRVLKNNQFSTFMPGYEVIINNVKVVDNEGVVQAVKTCNQKDCNVRHVTVSNPHLVVKREELIPNEELESTGSMYNSIIEKGINTNYFTVIREDSIYVKTYERGVGITLSCGTGMTSCATIHCLNSGYFNQWLNVYNDGGKVLCKAVREGNDLIVHFVGNATHICNIEAVFDDIISRDYLDLEGEINIEEKNSYERFFKQTRDELKGMGFDGYKKNM